MVTNNQYESAKATRETVPRHLSQIGGALGSLNQTLPVRRTKTVLKGTEVEMVITSVGTYQPECGGIGI